MKKTNKIALISVTIAVIIMYIMTLAIIFQNLHESNKEAQFSGSRSSRIRGYEYTDFVFDDDCIEPDWIRYSLISGRLVESDHPLDIGIIKTDVYYSFFDWDEGSPDIEEIIENSIILKKGITKGEINYEAPEKTAYTILLINDSPDSVEFEFRAGMSERYRSSFVFLVTTGVFIIGVVIIGISLSILVITVTLIDKIIKKLRNISK